MRFRICYIRGEVMNQADRGSEVLADQIGKAEAIVRGGRCAPGLKVYEWLSGQLVATITARGTEYAEGWAPAMVTVEPAAVDSYQAQLLGDQLSAEFHSPLNSTNRRRKLRPARGGADLFGTEPTQENLI